MERCILERDAAEGLANKYRPGPNTQKPPKSIADIPHSLLCAQHIVEIVKETGAVAPFYIEGGRKSRLKMSAYEGRIGDKAFIYDENGELKTVFERNCCKKLRVPKNQIVFVECDLDFRIPEFLALRFNLQIQHVHRGLLLGTGPLVDPGYWGKLCIPLHNLTDEDYYIPKDEGIIWIEFTKTTAIPDDAANPIGRPPLEKGKFFGDIKVFLNKASEQYGAVGVPIRSALPTMFGGIQQAVNKAERSARNARTLIFTIGAAGALGAIIAVLAIYFQAVSVVQDAGGTIRDAELIVSAAKDAGEKNKKADLEIQKLRLRIERLENKQ